MEVVSHPPAMEVLERGDYVLSLIQITCSALGIELCLKGPVEVI